MYSSSRKRCPKTKWALKLLTAAFLAASPAAKSAVNNAYDALIIEARKGNTQPALSWFALKSALSNNQIADWLQIALWAGQDKQVITVYNRYRHQQLPARGYAAVAVAYRNLQQWQNSLTLWQKALSLEPQNKDYQRGQILTWQMLVTMILRWLNLSSLTLEHRTKPIYSQKPISINWRGVIRMNYGR